MLLRIAIILVFLSIPKLLVAGPFQNLPSAPSLKPSFTSYMQMLLENQIVGTPELLRLVDGLERGVLENPIAEDSMEVDSNRRIHHKGLEDIISRAEVDHAEVLQWVRQSLQERGEVQVKREEIRVDTAVVPPDATLQFMDGIEDLLGRGTIGFRQLRSVLEGVQRKILLNPIFFEERDFSAFHKSQYLKFTNLIASGEVDFDELEAWLYKKLMGRLHKPNKCANVLSKLGL